MFFLSAFGDAHSKANANYADNALRVAFMVLKYPISSYYRMEQDNEVLITNIVKNIVANPKIKDDIFQRYGAAGNSLLELYSHIEKGEDFGKDFIEELARHIHNILIGQIYILHRADSFEKSFDILPGVADEIYALRKKYEMVFGGFEPHFAQLCEKLLNKVEGATVPDFRLLTPQELIESIQTGILPKEVIEQRKKLVIVSYLPEVQILTGNAAQEVYDAIKANEEKYKPVQNVQNEIKGTTVYGTGKVTGECKLITDYSLIETLEAGQILVTPSTLPKYNNVYKRARAIVTNEGGILAHTAILCREFKISGIVGTKVATQILKDGDTIEMDLDKGTVRKI
jgi:phosphohistidine swiveling domain-containing protein